jgi:hypothetical protein
MTARSGPAQATVADVASGQRILLLLVERDRLIEAPVTEIQHYGT